MTTPLVLALAMFFSSPQGTESPAATGVLRGRVVDARTGEPIAKALVSIRSHKIAAVTDDGGGFTLGAVPEGPVEITVTTVGYGLERRTVEAGSEAAELEIRLNQEALRREEEVAVTTAPFEPADPAAPFAHALAGTELENLASVLVDDPLRSVQSLPGVAAADDFAATFAARGLGFSNVGLYVDGVLMSAPFHTIRDVNDGFSLTLVTGDVVESLSLVSGGAPAPYGHRTGPVLAVKTREGSREKFYGRATLGATGLAAALEGPLGASRKTSWLVSARKSYLDYVLARLDEGGIVLGFYDATARLTHHPSPGHSVTLGLLHGRSQWRSTEPDLRPQDGHTADAGTDLATLQWRWLPSPRSWLESTVFFSRETGRNRNLDGTDDFRSTSGQWGLRTSATRVFGPHRLEGGLVIRGLSEDVQALDFDGRTASYRLTESYDAQTAEPGAYAQDTWTGLGGRLALTLGGRLDHLERTGETRALPRASLAWEVSRATRVVAAYGQYAQFPAFEQLLGSQGNPDLRAERATHYVLGVERVLGASTRLKLEAYDLSMSGLFFSADSEWRMQDGRVVAPRPNAPLRNALSGHSRGIEATLQRRSANGLSGWVAYSFGHARWQGEPDVPFDGDFDQRHAVTVFGSYRLSPTLNLSTKYRYGSGFPVAGYYEARPGGVFLSAERNLYRPQSYSRWDVRANKAFLFERWRLTLFAEVTNVLDRTNTRYTGLDGVDIRTGRVFLDSDTLFPILPAVGVTAEF